MTLINNNPVDGGSLVLLFNFRDVGGLVYIPIRIWWTLLAERVDGGGWDVVNGRECVVVGDPLSSSQRLILQGDDVRLVADHSAVRLLVVRWAYIDPGTGEVVESLEEVRFTIESLPVVVNPSPVPPVPPPEPPVFRVVGVWGVSDVAAYPGWVVSVNFRVDPGTVGEGSFVVVGEDGVGRPRSWKLSEDKLQFFVDSFGRGGLVPGKYRLKVSGFKDVWGFGVEEYVGEWFEVGVVTPKYHVYELVEGADQAQILGAFGGDIDSFVAEADGFHYILDEGFGVIWRVGVQVVGNLAILSGYFRDTGDGGYSEVEVAYLDFSDRSALRFWRRRVALVE